MHGIKLESGINDCHWNIVGKCTNYEITRNKRQHHFSRDYESKQNCVYTIIGVSLCGGYEKQK